MSKALLYPSTMCLTIDRIQEEVDQLIEAGVDGFHMDIMDGQYVPNIALGLNEFSYIRNRTKLTVDAHLMVENPSKFIDFFSDLGAEIIYFHPDNDKHPARTIDLIKKRNVKAGIVINPGLEITTVKSLLAIADYVLVMTVNPGFAGQKYLDYVDNKWDELMELKEKYGFTVFVDGAISKERILKLHKIGVDGFVLGTSALFGKEPSYSELIHDIRKDMNQA